MVSGRARAAPHPTLMTGQDDGRAAGQVSHEDLVRQFEVLEARIDAALELIDRLRREKDTVDARLAESESLRREAAQRLAALLDRLEPLL